VGGELVRGGFNVWVYILCVYTTRQNSTTRRVIASHAPATLVCTGSFISQELYFLSGCVSKILELLLVPVSGEHVKVETSWCFFSYSAPHAVHQGYSTSVASGPNKKITGGVRAAENIDKIMAKNEKQ